MQIVPREWLLDGLQHLEAFFLGLACVERREDVPRVLREEICCERLYVLWHLYDAGRMRVESLATGVA